MMWLARTGAQWLHLPGEYGYKHLTLEDRIEIYRLRADGKSLLKRGRMVFSYSLSRLIAGCGSSFAVGFGIILIVVFVISSLGWNESTAGGISVFQVALSVISSLLFAFAFVMLPVVLSRAYLLAELNTRA
jgi:hypothetical protein